MQVQPCCRLVPSIPSTAFTATRSTFALMLNKDPASWSIDFRLSSFRFSVEVYAIVLSAAFNISCKGLFRVGCGPISTLGP